MKIVTLASSLIAKSRQVAESSAKIAKSQARSSASDTVKLSDAASRLSQISLDKVSEADPARLAELRESVKDGSFSVDVRQLAEAIIREDSNGRVGGSK